MAGLNTTTHDRPRAAPPTRAPAAAGGLGRGLVAAWAPLRAVARLRDRLDESSALRARLAHGRLGRLLSWRRGPDGLWVARLSGPEAPRTVERSAATRRGAIARAGRALDRYGELRDGLGPRPGPATGGGGHERPDDDPGPFGPD